MQYPETLIVLLNKTRKNNTNLFPYLIIAYTFNVERPKLGDVRFKIYKLVFWYFMWFSKDTKFLNTSF